MTYSRTRRSPPPVPKKPASTVEKAYFTVADFAKLSRTSRNTLHHYDAIGLLSPALRGENNYRYYTSGQLAVVNVIQTLQALGMSLAEIKALGDRRSPEFSDEVLAKQIDRIDRRIEDWDRAKKLILTLRKSIQSVKNVDEDAITIQYLPEESIILGDPNDYSRGGNDYHALGDFYDTMARKQPDLDLNYPVWAVFSEERIKRGDWIWPDRYYFYNPGGNDRRPAALYAIGYKRGGYGQSGDLYRRMLAFIDDSGFEICGNAYEEYPLNEICIADSSRYLMRVMIMVKGKLKGRDDI